jgi:hypothetical protein
LVAVYIRWGVALRAPVQGTTRHHDEPGDGEGGDDVTEIQYALYVGVDWATTAHQVAILDRDRRVLAERVVAHSGSSAG